MSTLSVTTINTANGTTDLTFGTGNTSAGKIVVNSVGGLVLYQNSSSNSFVANSTATMLQVSGANAVVANSTVTTLAIGGTTGLTVNTTAAVFGGTVADSTATLRPLVPMTSVALSSQSTVDFTGIPSWVRKITVLFHQVSLSGGDKPLLQLGTSGGFVTTGYQSWESSSGTSTSGILIPGTTSTDTRSGSFQFFLIDGVGLWVCTGLCNNNGGSISSDQRILGIVNLAAALTQVRLTRTGTNTFDGGTVNILYE